MWISNKGYRLIAIQRDGKRKLVSEHRHLMEQALGRRLGPREVVHHINGDRLDNRLSNLAVWEVGAHNRHHREGKPRPSFRGHEPWNKGTKAIAEAVCAICTATFTRELRYIRHAQRRGRRLVCSYKCRAASANIRR